MPSTSLQVADRIEAILENATTNETLQQLATNAEFSQTLEDAIALASAAEAQLRRDDDTAILDTLKKLSELHATHIEHVTFDAFWLPEHHLRKFIRDSLQAMLAYPLLEEMFNWNSGDEDWAYAGIPAGQFGFVQEKKSPKKKRGNKRRK